jgi:hypothetical protein
MKYIKLKGENIKIHLLYNNIVLSMLYAEICPTVRRLNARPVRGHISAYNMDNTILLLLMFLVI